MSKRVMTMLVGVVALAMLIGGCGSSDDETSAAEPLTKAQYVKQGSKLCAKAGEQIGRELTTVGKNSELSKGKKDSENTAEKAMEVVMVPGFRAEIEGLEGLTPPEADEEQVEAMLEKFNVGLDEAEEDPTTLFTNSQFPEGTEAAEKYGLEGCGTLFL